MNVLCKLPSLVFLVGLVPLTHAETHDVSQAVSQAVCRESHWAFQPVRDFEPPRALTNWSNHPIDRFVAHVWREHGLSPVAPADPTVLLRRVYFDLIGLPPTPGEIQEFEAQTAKDPEVAWSGVLDRLLASPHYGERWGRHWMDVVRYADTAGDNADYPVPEAQLYRDFIIGAFNADMPFDQFVREQLAGDLIAGQEHGDRYADQVTATGFLALSRRYATGPYELWHLTLEDTIDTVGQALIGISLKCARCHDHKFDPVTTEDYYALYGIFSSTQFPWAGGEEFQSMKRPRQHFVPLLPNEDVAPRWAEYHTQLDELSEQMAQLDEQLTSADRSVRHELEARRDDLRAEHTSLHQPGLPPGIPGAYAVQDGQPHDVAVQIDGDPTNPGLLVPRNAIAFLCPEPLSIPDGNSGRLQLAQWITSPAHPLTARVLVNRVWQHHFGRGIVATPSNFGTSGSLPSHPELLDYLTRQFTENGWSIKQLHRLILTSRTWQLSSAHDSENANIDTGNRFYWRHDRCRLDAESVRDAMLSVSGELILDRPAPHPLPPIHQWHWTQHNPFKERYDSSHRSVYLMTQRLQKHPFLALFDGPDANTTTGMRTSAIVTPQSLYVMNSPEIVRIAGAFADRLMSEASVAGHRIDLAYQLCFARRPNQDESLRDERYIESVVEALQHDRAMVHQERRAAWLSYAKVLLSSSEFFYLD